MRQKTETVKGLETKICDEHSTAVRSLEKQLSTEMQDIRAIMNGELASSKTNDSIVAVEEKVIQEAQLSLRDRATRCQLKSGKILHKCSTDCT